MYIDSRLELSVKQAVAAAGPSTNVIDVGSSPRHIGPGQPMYVVVQTDAVVAADVTVTVQTADAAGFFWCRSNCIRADSCQHACWCPLCDRLPVLEQALPALELRRRYHRIGMADLSRASVLGILPSPGLRGKS